MVLGAALASGSYSHAYLFHGPAGTGKRTAARALAAELLAEGDPDPGNVRHRVLESHSHPDLTWVTPTGAHVMRVADIDEAVVSAATRTPFESRRRVFVLEGVDTMNDEVANRLLKTLEEPASFVHLILVTDSLPKVIDTVVSRCQLVRFDPLPADTIAAGLERAGVPGERARACGRLALGDASRARFLASEEGEALRSDVERLVRRALAGEASGTDTEPWRGLLVRAEESKRQAEKEVAEDLAERLQYEPKGRDRKAVEREFEETAKRSGRRERTRVLNLGLELATLSFRDLVCVAEGAEDCVLATDRIGVLAAEARGRDPRRLREALERCEDARLSLELNVTEDLALSALLFRLERLVGSPG
jgi:DNA polymerase-3 subunit delta'